MLQYFIHKLGPILIGSTNDNISSCLSCKFKEE
uniref:Uncharacterized protein n=1 Tax=Rhizophora mucronata TaxID=61149 RepID=A0A2P2N9Z1_RHIMU